MLPFIHMTLPEFVQAIGYLGLFTIVLMETGLPFGFIFPGDSLLFTAGLLASEGLLSIPLVCLAVTLGAIIGCGIGYALGWKVGPAIFKKEDSLFFSTRYVRQTEAFYEKYGPRSLVLARFIPGVRTFVPLFAGIGRMRFLPFIIYNLVGGLLWGILVPAAGYWLGHTFPASQEYLSPIVIVILTISTLPVIFEMLRARSKKSKN